MQVIQIALLEDRLDFTIDVSFAYLLFLPVDFNNRGVTLILAKHYYVILLDSIERLAHHMVHNYLCSAFACIELH